MPKTIHLEECLLSIKQQTLEKSRFLVHFVFDGYHSSNLVKLISKVFNTQVRHKITMQPKLGLKKILNIALKECQTPYFARMDCDDIMNPNRLEYQLNFMISHDNIALCGSRVEYIDDRSNVVKTSSLEYPLSDFRIRLMGAFYNNPLVHPSIMAKTLVAQELGGYTSNTPAEDYGLWSKFKHHQIANIPNRLLKYRIHPIQLTRNVPINYMLITKIRVEFFRGLIYRYGVRAWPLIAVFPLTLIPMKAQSVLGIPIKYLLRYCK